MLQNHLPVCPYLPKDLQPVRYTFLSDNDAESYNEMLRDFVNKQELQRDLRSYIDAATRKEALRMSYLDLIRDKYVIKYVLIRFNYIIVGITFLERVTVLSATCHSSTSAIWFE